jgi:LysR family transcriptional regulator, regulator for genes of the gallate degradation pathway
MPVMRFLSAFDAGDAMQKCNGTAKWEVAADHNFLLIGYVRIDLPNIRHCAALAATVRHGSVSSAARAVNLSQPALTQAIAALESNLDVTLFERSSVGMVPTQPAILLARRIEIALEHIGSTRVTSTQLRAFIAVGRTGSYKSAAQTLDVKPASVHRAVADLSIALGQLLLDKRGRTLFLTAAGQRRLRRFGLAIAELNAGLAEVASWQGKARGRIVIGAMSLSRARWLPSTLDIFAANYPDVDIVVHEGSHGELIGPLRDGEIDLLLGALRDVTEIDDLEQEAVFDDHPQIIMRAGHPLLKSASTTQDLRRFSWILPGQQTPLRRFWRSMFAQLGIDPPRVQIECGSVVMIRQLLLSGDSLTLLSPRQVSIELETGLLSALPAPMSISRTIGITTRIGWRPTREQQMLLQMLRERTDG